MTKEKNKSFMTENELAAYNVAFCMHEIMPMDEFIDSSIKELGDKVKKVIKKPGNYAIKVIVTEILMPEISVMEQK